MTLIISRIIAEKNATQISILYIRQSVQCFNNNRTMWQITMETNGKCSFIAMACSAKYKKVSKSCTNIGIPHVFVVLLSSVPINRNLNPFLHLGDHVSNTRNILTHFSAGKKQNNCKIYGISPSGLLPAHFCKHQTPLKSLQYPQMTNLYGQKPWTLFGL